MPRMRVWLIDGHNMIFAVHGLQVLQAAGRGEEARRGLQERLEVFALRRQERVVLVFDGDARASGQAAVRSAHFEVVFARGGEGAADDFIVREARRCAEDGRPVVVVTNDVRTLASRLPRDIVRHGVREFWLAHVEPRRPADDKQVGVDVSDLEREMLAQAAVSERADSVWPDAGRQPAQPASPRDAAADLRQRRRQKGRLRQERLLERRRGGARRG